MPFDNTIRKAGTKSTNRQQQSRKEIYLTHGKTRGLPPTLTQEVQDGLNASMQHVALSRMVCRRLRHSGQLNLLAARLCPSGRRRLERIVRPGMPWITAPHFCFDVPVAAAPKAGQIPC